MQATAQVRNVDTLQLFPSKIPILSTTTKDSLQQSATDIIAILKNPPTHLPYLLYGDATRNILVYIACILGRASLNGSVNRILESCHEPIPAVCRVP
jgi:hypothetical protein